MGTWKKSSVSLNLALQAYCIVPLVQSLAFPYVLALILEVLLFESINPDLRSPVPELTSGYRIAPEQKDKVPLNTTIQKRYVQWQERISPSEHVCYLGQALHSEYAWAQEMKSVPPSEHACIYASFKQEEHNHSTEPFKFYNSKNVCKGHSRHVWQPAIKTIILMFRACRVCFV